MLAQYVCIDTHTARRAVSVTYSRPYFVDALFRAHRAKHSVHRYPRCDRFRPHYHRANEPGAWVLKSLAASTIPEAA